MATTSKHAVSRRTLGLVAGGLASSVMALSATGAQAGGFAPHEQSAYFMGTAFAGSAAGGVLSSMFWNPAALGQFNGVQMDSSYSLILPDTEITVTGGAFFGSGTSRSSGDIGDTAILPASYMSYQLNDQIVLGLGINAPFGLTTDANPTYDGRFLHNESKITTYNFTPTVAYRVNDMITIGAGLQVQYIDAQLRQTFYGVGTPLAGLTGRRSAIKGTDTGFGFTAGILITPSDQTSIGLGFRSKIKHDLDGTFHIAGVPPKSQIGADVDLPEIVTLSLRQVVAPNWTFLGSVEWTNWSRVPELRVICDSGLTCPGPAAGTPLAVLPLGWNDGWMFSGGIEHNYSEQLTLRGGIAYEISPIDSAEGRTLRVPDADRFWLTAGASYKMNENTTIDFSYAHVFVEDAKTRQEEIAPGVFGIEGDVDSSADIISVGVRSKLDWLLSGGH